MLISNWVIPSQNKHYFSFAYKILTLVLVILAWPNILSTNTNLNHLTAHAILKSLPPKKTKQLYCLRQKKKINGKKHYEIHFFYCLFLSFDTCNTQTLTHRKNNPNEVKWNKFPWLTWNKKSGSTAKKAATTANKSTERQVENPLWNF